MIVDGKTKGTIILMEDDLAASDLAASADGASEDPAAIK